MCGIGLRSIGLWLLVCYIATVNVGSTEDILTFRGGKDVYGRDRLCRACHHIIGNLQESLLPRLVALSQDKRALKQYGAVEGLIQDVVPEACMFSATYHQRRTWKECQTILETYEDDIIRVYYKFSQGLVGPGTAAASNFNFNNHVCVEATRSCPQRLGAHELAEFTEPASERVYKSERRPKPGDGRGPVLKLTAETFYEEVIANNVRDVLVYFSFPRSHEDIHAGVLPVLKRTAHVFAELVQDRTPGLMLSHQAPIAAILVAAVDLELNDVPPPFGQDVHAPAIALYPASLKTNPRFMSNLKSGDLAVFDMLHFLSVAGAATSTLQLASTAQSRLSYEQLYLSVNDMRDRDQEYL
eukprot:jgi/Mesvir1/1719/Mv21172-RA.1